jgi:hypothetical protein
VIHLAILLPSAGLMILGLTLIIDGALQTIFEKVKNNS